MKILYILIIILLFLTVGCDSQMEEYFERSEVAMGTVVTLKATGPNAQFAVDEAFQKITEVERQINEDISKIESTAGNTENIEISIDVYDMLNIAQEYSILTNGVLDVTIGAAVELWGIGTQNPRVPSAEELEQVKAIVGHEHLHLRESDHSARLDKSGVKLDLGGLAKGYAVDIVRTIFDKYSIEDGLIDFGTSTIYAMSDKRIGLKNPQNPEEIARIVDIKNSAISTSGDYERYFTVEGKRYHHIIDPRTCSPAETTFHSVSVVVEGSEEHCATVADILSTTLFISGINNIEGLPQKKVITLSGD